MSVTSAAVRLGIASYHVIVVEATGNAVGFADQLTVSFVESHRGWHEVGPYNAFFARVSEYRTAAAKMANCAHIGIEFTDYSDETVIGFVHSTKINMRGESKYSFTGQQGAASYTQHVLKQAMAHYNAGPASCYLRLTASIKPENYRYNFHSPEAMDEHFPGLNAAGFIYQTDDASLLEASRRKPWLIDAHGLILHDIQEAIVAVGIPREHFVDRHMLDAADTQGVHSSHVDQRKPEEDFRDPYGVMHASAVISPICPLTGCRLFLVVQSVGRVDTRSRTLHASGEFYGYRCGFVLSSLAVYAI